MCRPRGPVVQEVASGAWTRLARGLKHHFFCRTCTGKDNEAFPQLYLKYFLSAVWPPWTSENRTPNLHHFWADVINTSFQDTVQEMTDTHQKHWTKTRWDWRVTCLLVRSLATPTPSRSSTSGRHDIPLQVLRVPVDPFFPSRCWVVWPASSPVVVVASLQRILQMFHTVQPMASLTWLSPRHQQHL